MSNFDRFFSSIYGERWPRLLAALQEPPRREARDCFGGHARYVIDSASVRAAQALQVRPGDEVLDLCAAPGGKALVLLEALGGRGSLTANELSSARRRRLQEVMETCAPEGARQLLRITGWDGNRFGIQRKDSFDRVLLDAPCSSERHLLEEDAGMADWKPSRTRQLALRQYSLICSALLTLRKGGVLLYSTCSISPGENDGVIERLLQRKEGQVRIDPDSSDLGDCERTRFGFQLFPDEARGAGPIFFCRLRKT